MQKGIITRLEIQKRGKERVNVFLDGEFAFSLNLMDAAKLHKGQMLTDAEIEVLRGEDAVVKAVNQSARFLAYRPRSTQEVRQNLEQKGTAPEVIDAALAKLTDMGHLDDLAFARYWVENRNTFKPLSPQALRYELRQKGIADAIIHEVLADLDVDYIAYQAALERAQRLHGTTRHDFQEKIATFLQRRGFSYNQARDVIERLIDEMDMQDTEFFQPEDELE